MLPEEIVKIVTDTISGIRAKNYVQAISSHHRIQASPGIHDAIISIKKEIDSFLELLVKEGKIKMSNPSSLNIQQMQKQRLVHGKLYPVGKQRVES